MNTGMRWPLVLLMTMFLVVAGGAQGASRQAEIVAPRPGGELPFGGVIEIALKGLTARDAVAMVVQGWSHPVNRELDRRPITRCDGSYFVHVVESPTLRDDQCAAFMWTDRAAGEAKLWVRWSHRPEGFVDGEHMVRIEIYVEPTDAPLGRWNETGWHLLSMAPRTVTPDPPPPPPEPELSARFVELVPGREFELGSQVEVEGRVLHASLPVEVRLEVGAGHVPDNWHTVDQGRFDKARFSLVWDTDELLASRAPRAGVYQLRGRVEDADGDIAYTEPVRVVLVDPPAPSLSLLVDGQVVTEVRVDARQPVQFGLRTEPEGREDYWASFHWDLGDGNESHEMWPMHAFTKEGTYEVLLTAWTEPGHSGRATSARVQVRVRERPVLSMHREIWGYPVPQSDSTSVLPGFTVHVRLQIKTLDALVGLGITEVAPAGWQIEDLTEILDPKLEVLTTPSAAGNRMTWIITSREPALRAGTEISIQYTLHVPATAKLDRASLSGAVHVRLDAKREVNLSVAGASEVKVLAALPVCVAIAYLEKAGPDEGLRLRAPAVGDNYLISPEQIAIARDLIGREVPHTSGATMTAETYLRLRAYLEGEVPVTACGGE